MFFEALAVINKQWKLRRLPEVSVRVSVSSGQTVIGNVGSYNRLSYTAIGNNVNIGSRLVELNKLYGSQILISEDTYRQVKDQFLCRLVDRVSVRGQTKSIYIYEIFRRDDMQVISQEQLADYNKGFFDAFKFYEVGDWDKSLLLFENLSKVYPKDNLLLLYIDRCKLLKSRNPNDWDGVWKF
jgi:adenylate cyclase